MKSIFSILLIVLSTAGFTQQSQPIKSQQHADDNKNDSNKKNQDYKIPILILYGIGNINEEALSQINSSGKISFLFTPYQSDSQSLFLNISANKNATNKDTLLASTLLFPEVGSHSFIGTVGFSIVLDLGADFRTNNIITPFFEFAYKKISKEIKDTVNNELSVDKKFFTLNYTVGMKFSMVFQEQAFNGSFSLIPYLSFFNIPDEDREDYVEISKQNFKFLNNANSLNDSFKAFGIKTVIEMNKFQFFVDFRHVLRKNTIQVRELRGLKMNIGFVFNANITPEDKD